MPGTRDGTSTPRIGVRRTLAERLRVVTRGLVDDAGRRRSVPSRSGWSTTGNSQISDEALNVAMSTDRFDAAIARAMRRRHASLVGDLIRLREDAGVTRSALARAAGVDRRHLDRIENGTDRASLEAYQRLATALGADLSTRLYPNTGPALRDRHQARILETLLEAAHPRWQPFTEVAVRRPSRGWIDVLLYDARGRVALATEIESELRRLEQQLRWAAEKAAALPSWEGWSQLGEAPLVSRLLVVRRTRATRAVATAMQRQLLAAYPAHPDDALAALAGSGPWPGPAMVWAVISGGATRLAGSR